MKNTLSLLALLIFTIGLSSCALAQSAPAYPPNFAKVNDSIYRGGRPTLNDITTLAKMGIKTVVNLQGGDLADFKYRLIVKRLEPGELPEAIAAERQAVIASGMESINVPLDSLDPVTTSENSAIDQLLTVLNMVGSQPFFIHCEHGQDRTGLIIALYRIQHDGWTPQKAYAEWEAFGHDELHKLFTDDLDSYYLVKSKQLARTR
jgi:tyrosine-protein phosphatase SIW14